MNDFRRKFCKQGNGFSLKHSKKENNVPIIK